MPELAESRRHTGAGRNPGHVSVIAAKAAIQGMYPSLRRRPQSSTPSPSLRRRPQSRERERMHWVPAYAGMTVWVPACAGMTVWVPAYAGMTVWVPA